MSYDNLSRFRQRAHQYMGRAHDATFELIDAVMTTRRVYSFVELSQSPLFRRKWSSIYETLQDSRPQHHRLKDLYVEQMPTDGQLVLAGDHTAWPRPDAKRLRERTYEHQANSRGAGDSQGPVTLGQGYSTVAWIPETAGSWALPLYHERITSWESPLSKAAWQLRQVCKKLPSRPLSLWDSEYGCASFVLKTADIKADKLMRVRSNRNLWGSPPAYQGRGRPRLHGELFKLNDSTTWRSADQDITVAHAKLGRVRVRCWNNLHFRQSARHPMTLLQIQRLDDAGQPREGRPLWLIWVGLTMPPLDPLWRCYLRRFAVDHWYRFIKQRLHWTLPKLGDPKAAERWSTLLPLASWQLWLARDSVQGSPLPWQKNLRSRSPGQVADSMATLLTALGTPATSPKPRGKSPGWPSGQPRNRKGPFPPVRKRFKPPKKSPQKVV